MFYRKLGNTGCLVGEIGVSAWTRDGADALAAAEVAVQTLRAALDRGATFIDVADVAESAADADVEGHEQVVGRAIAGRRAHALLATRAGLVRRGDGLQRDFSPENIAGAAHASLARLDCGHIDVYQLHHPTVADLRDERLWEALAELKAKGTIRHVGVVAETLPVALAALEDRRVETLQIVLNPFDYALLPVLARARAAGVGVIAGAPLGTGFCSGTAAERDFLTVDGRENGATEEHEIATRFLQRFNALAAGSDRTPAQLALGWVLAQEEVSVAVPRMSNPAHLAEHLAASDLPLPSPRQLAAIQHLQLTGQPAVRG